MVATRGLRDHVYRVRKICSGLSCFRGSAFRQRFRILDKQVAVFWLKLETDNIKLCQLRAKIALNGSRDNFLRQGLTMMT